MLLNMSKNKSLTDIISETNEKICARLDTTNELLTKLLAQSMKNQTQVAQEKEPVKIKIKIGEKIRAIRINRGLMSSWLSKKVGMNESYISAVENGYRNPSEEILKKIETILGTKLGDD